MNTIPLMTLSLATKLGSIARHAEEAVSDAHDFDIAAIQGLLDDPEVAEWMREMDALSLLPVLRSQPTEKT